MASSERSANDDGEYLLTSQQQKPSKRRWQYVTIALAVIVLIVIGAVVGASSTGGSSESFVSAVKSDNIMVHIRKLYDIAQTTQSPFNPLGTGCRSVLYGYNKSAEYVLEQLQQRTDLIVSTQPLVVPIFEELATPKLSFGGVTFVEGVDFQSLRYGGDGDHVFTAPFLQIDNYGCDPADFAELESRPANSVVALIRDGGGCDYFTKGLNAQNAGARSGIIHRADNTTKTLSWSRVRKTGWVMGDPIVEIPFLSSTYSLAQFLNSQPTEMINWETHTRIVMAGTFNIIAETPRGNSAKTIIMGSHLDSVPGGPGLNDNGSGSTMNLELAIQFARLIKKPVNKVQFIWWASEEEGLLGSYHYVNQLSTEARKNVACGLNFDMMASPNGLRYVYDTSGLPAGVSNTTRDQSEYVASLFRAKFDAIDKPWVPIPLSSAGSDFYPFIVADLCAGGLATGASSLRTIDDRLKWGGLTNAQYDPCYHQPCDTPENLDQAMLQDMATASAGVLESMAMNATLFNQ